MNRHQRRAAAKSPPKPQPAQQSTLSLAMSPAGDGVSFPKIDLSGDAAPTVRTDGAPPGLGLRLFSKILLSKFVLNRVKQPEVEKLLMSVALEVGRTDVVDELTRRQAARSVQIISL
ncbi:MAG: hypothetical protein JNK21_03015 [Rhodospirillaceae bacterium]|nr:hypothetical protein [Rhodospirillaceae bacterium]